MNREETAHLLAVMQTYDQRTVGETDVIAWHAILSGLSFEACRQAVVTHYSNSTDRAMPAHIRRLVAAAKSDRLSRVPAIDRSMVRKTDPPPEWYELRKRLAARPRRQPESFAAAMADMGQALEQTAATVEQAAT